MSWTRDAIAAFLLDDPKMDVDPLRASKRAATAMKLVFGVGADNRRKPKFQAKSSSSSQDAKVVGI
jgi:hypothetical protein